MSHQWELVLSSSFKLSHLVRGKMPHPWQTHYQHSCSASQANQNDLWSHGFSHSPKRSFRSFSLQRKSVILVQISNPLLVEVINNTHITQCLYYHTVGNLTIWNICMSFVFQMDLNLHHFLFSCTGIRKHCFVTRNFLTYLTWRIPSEILT